VTKPVLLPDFVWPAKYRQCTMCPAGTFTSGASAIRTRCTFCPRGTTTEGAGCGDGGDCCSSCAPGWAWDAAKSVCSPCASGSFSPGGPKVPAGSNATTTAVCEDCEPNDIGVPGFTLAGGAASVKQCLQYPVCPDVTEDTDTCEDSNYIIRKGFNIPQEDGTGVATTQHYNKKVRRGREGEDETSGGRARARAPVAGRRRRFFARYRRRRLASRAIDHPRNRPPARRVSSSLRLAPLGAPKARSLAHSPARAPPPARTKPTRPTTLSPPPILHKKTKHQTNQNPKVGDGVEGYYCVACTPGTLSDNCITVGGTCVVDVEDLPTPSPEYKKLRETHFKKIGSYHARGDVNDDDGDLPGVDPVEGYKKVKYTYSGEKVENGGNKGDGGDDDKHSESGKGGGKGGHGGKDDDDKTDDDKTDDDDIEKSASAKKN